MMAKSTIPFWPFKTQISSTPARTQTGDGQDRSLDDGITVQGYNTGTQNWRHCPTAGFHTAQSSQASPSYRPITAASPNRPFALDLTWKKYPRQVRSKLAKSGHSAKPWRLEMISLMLSSLCMTAIIIALAFLAGKPPPDWVISLNTYVSILSRIASAAIIFPVSEALGQLKWSWFQGNTREMGDFEAFDHASRGPWGSLLLIPRILRIKCTSLAALGAVITVLAMALDPFFQQVVHYPQVTVQSGTPTITSYSGSSYGFYRNGDIFYQDSHAQLIADEYFSGSNTPIASNMSRKSNLPVQCPSIECSWAPFQTLAVCSKCVEVTDMLEFGCHQAPLDWTQNATVSLPHENGTMCGWFLNASEPNPTLMLGYSVDPVTNETLESLFTRSLPLTTVLDRHPLFGGSINFKHVRNRLIDFIVASPKKQAHVISDPSFWRARPIAHECMLSMCVKTLNASYVSGDYTEAVMESFQNTSDTVVPHPWSEERSTEFDTVQYYYSENATIIPPMADERENFIKYFASSGTIHALITAFDDYLPSFSIRTNNSPKVFMKYKLGYKEIYLREYIRNPWDYPKGLSKHMDDLARRLTDMMRSSNTNLMSISQSGETYILATKVAVRWLYLIYPIGLLILTCVFFAATIVHSAAQQKEMGTEVWKNSALATLIYGLPDTYREGLQVSGMDTLPEDVKTLRAEMLLAKNWQIQGKSSPKPS